MDDLRTTVAQMRDIVARFVYARGWNRFHTPKNLSMSIAIEAAELMELFQWSAGDGTLDVDHRAIEAELADVLIYCLSLANCLGIDISGAVSRKVSDNEKRFPPEPCAVSAAPARNGLDGC